MDASRPSTASAADARPAAPRSDTAGLPLDTLLLINAAIFGTMFGGALTLLVAEGWRGRPWPVIVAFFVSAVFQILAVAAVLVRRRAERGLGLGVRFDDRFRWIDRPDEEEAHDAAVLARLPRRIASLRLVALALQTTSFLALYPLVRGGAMPLVLYLAIAAPWAREAERLRRRYDATKPETPGVTPTDVTPSGACPGSR